MANYTKLLLSGSDGGRNIAITTTATPGVTVHTATASVTDDALDEIWIWAGSTAATASVMVGLTWGSGNNPKDQIQKLVPGEGGGLTPLALGLLLRSGYVVTATASVAGKINLSGYVHRISGQSS